jgi:hypothetical protein
MCFQHFAGHAGKRQSSYTLDKHEKTCYAYCMECDMPLLKAWQNTATGPEYVKYVEALTRYQQVCRRYSKVPKEFRFSSDPLQQLQFFREKELYITECKRFHAARNEWIKFKAEQKLGTDLTPEKVAELLRLEIPSTMTELIKDAKQNAIASTFKDGELERLKQEVIDRANAKALEDEKQQTTRERFQSSTVRDDPTFGDDAPLPE